jgi:hypothetical protein
MEAMRCLKRRRFDLVDKQMVADAKKVRDGSGRTLGSDSAIQRGQPNPVGQLFG